MSYPIEYGLDRSQLVSASVGNLTIGFEVDCQSPEVVTANQRACEVQIRDWIESQGVVITR